MWFDVAAALADIEAHPPATAAASQPEAPPVSQLSQVSQAPEAAPHALATGSAGPVALSPPSQPRPSRPAPSAPGGGTFRHGVTGGGRPRTWTGRIVSLEEWRGLSEWERHGPDGRLWCGCCRAWVPRETALAHTEAGRAEWLAQCAGTGAAAPETNTERNGR